MTEIIQSDPTSEPGDAKALKALNHAALIIAAERSLDKVLQKIVDLAREMVNARFAALGVPGADGRMAQFIVSGLSDEEVARIRREPAGRGILGLLLQDPQTLNLPDLNRHPESVGFPPHHPYMRTFLGVSITARGVLLGNLYLTEKIDAAAFSIQDARLIQALAAHAAVAIENAQLDEQVRRLAVLEERERIGMDLHDGIIQSIYAVGLSLELGKMVINDSPDETKEHIALAISGLDSIIRDLRSYIMDLQPARIQDEPLAIALERLVREFKANTLVQVNLTVSPDSEDGLGDSCRFALFHITQEALANIAKHAHATQVAVTLGRMRDRLILNIKDNGAGFDSDKIGGIPGHGLSNMAVRARTLGGELTVTSAQSNGTHVRAVIPANPTTSTPPALVSFP